MAILLLLVAAVALLLVLGLLLGALLLLLGFWGMWRVCAAEAAEGEPVARSPGRTRATPALATA